MRLLLEKLGYFKYKQEPIGVSGDIVHKRTSAHIWIDDNLSISKVSQEKIRSYVSSTIKEFYETVEKQEE